MEENNQQQDVQGVTPAGDVEVLGVRPSGRVLLITDETEPGGGAASLKTVLEAGGHTVALAPPEQAQPGVAMTRPDLVMFEIGDKATAAKTCRLLRSGDNRVAIMAVVDNAFNTDEWPELQAAGFDDWTSADVSSSAIESRIEVLLRLAQTGRELDSARARLARYMQVDEATGLLNRRFFFQNAYREASRARRYGHDLACLMIDIDHLDEMSKTYGYASVEYVLRAVAYTVRQWTRDSDIGGRFNDRKFVVLLPETDIEGAISVRGKILEALEEGKFEWEGRELPVTVSIGEAERGKGSTPSTHETLEESLSGDSSDEPLTAREELAALLEDADGALSVAKRANKRAGIFVPYTPANE